MLLQLQLPSSFDGNGVRHGTGVVLLLCLCLVQVKAYIQIDTANVSFFEREPEPSFFKPKQIGTLYCEPHAAIETTSISWYRNGSRIDWSLVETRDKFEDRLKGNGRELVFKQFMPTMHAGSYQCLLQTSTIGAILSRPALVQLATVEMSSRSARKEVSLTTLPSNIVLIPCDSPFDVSVPRAEISFELNGTALQLRSERHLITSDGRLLIKQARNIDSGTYQCVLTNRHANVMLRSNVEYSLIVQALRRAPATLLHKSASTLRASVGDNITILCIYAGNPLPAVEWELPVAEGRTTLANSDRLVVDPKGFIHITNLSAEDAGTYRCKFSNERGQKTESFTLQVDGPPSVTLNAASVMSNSKGLTLRCDVSRATTSFWMLNGDRLNNGDLSIALSKTTKRSGDEMRLTVPQLFNEHRGVYQCFAENQYGTSVRSARVDLLSDSPSRIAVVDGLTSASPQQQRRRASLIKIAKDNQTRQMGEAVVFSCIAWPATGLEFRWLFNGSPLPFKNDVDQFDEDDISSLLISGLTANHSGAYTCVVQTRSTYDEASVYLTVQDDSSTAEAIAQAADSLSSATTTTMSPAKRRRPTTPLSSLPTQLNARLAGSNVQLSWVYPSSDLQGAVDSSELQYCRDCRLRNAQSTARSWRTMNETLDLTTKRHTLRGLPAGTYVFRISVRYPDGSTQWTNVTAPISVPEAAENADVDNPFAEITVECVSERNCSFVWTRWSYDATSRLLRESWDGVAILIADIDRNTVTKKLVAGLSTTSYQVAVEPNRQLEFTVNLVRSGERSPGLSTTINTYADEDGLLASMDIDSVIAQTVAPTQSYIQVPVEMAELAEDGNPEAANGTQLLDDAPTQTETETQVKIGFPLDILHVVLATAGAIATAIVLILLIICVLRSRMSGKRCKQTKYIAASKCSGDAASQKPLSSGICNFMDSESNAYDILSSNRIAYVPVPNIQAVAPQKASPGRMTIDLEQNHSGSTTVSCQSHADDNGQVVGFGQSNISAITTCDDTSRSSSRQPSDANAFANPDSVRFEGNRCASRADVSADMNILSSYAQSVGTSVIHKFGTLPLKSGRTSMRTAAANGEMRVATTPTGNCNSSALGLPPFALPNVTDLGTLGAPEITPQPCNLPWQTYTGSAQQHPLPHPVAMIHPQDGGVYMTTADAPQRFATRQNVRHSRKHGSHRQRASNSPHGSASGSSSGSVVSTCDCADCCDCDECQLQSNRAAHMHMPHSIAKSQASGTLIAPMPLTFALPPPPPLPADCGNVSPTRRSKKPPKAKRSDSGIDDSALLADGRSVRRTRTLREEEPRRARSRSRGAPARSERSRSRNRQRAGATAINVNDTAQVMNRSRGGPEPSLVVMLNRNDVPISMPLSSADCSRQTAI